MPSPRRLSPGPRRGLIMNTDTHRRRHGLRWAVEQRLDYIDALLETAGGLRRPDIVMAFGVSPNQATADLRLFMTLHPGAMVYDRRAKRYIPTESPYRRRRPDGAAMHIHPTRPEADGIPFDDLSTAPPALRTVLTVRGLVWLTEFAHEGENYSGNVIAATKAQAAEIADARGHGERVLAQLHSTSTTRPRLDDEA